MPEIKKGSKWTRARWNLLNSYNCYYILSLKVLTLCLSLTCIFVGIVGTHRKWMRYKPITSLCRNLLQPNNLISHDNKCHISKHSPYIMLLLRIIGIQMLNTCHVLLLIHPKKCHMQLFRFKTWLITGIHPCPSKVKVFMNQLKMNKNSDSHNLHWPLEKNENILKT